MMELWGCFLALSDLLLQEMGALLCTTLYPLAFTLSFSITFILIFMVSQS